MNEPLMTIKQVMQKLQVSNDVLYAMVRRGELSSVRVGRLHRFDPQEIEEYLKKQKHGSFSSRVHSRTQEE